LSFNEEQHVRIAIPFTKYPGDLNLLKIVELYTGNR
jgi:hypothetical protein